MSEEEYKITQTNFNTFNDDVYQNFSKLITRLQEGEVGKEMGKKLFNHQRFLYEFMAAHNKLDYSKTNSRGLLLYHKLGSGKTISAIALAEACRKYEITDVQSKSSDFKVKPSYKRKVIIMMPANLKKDPWMREFKHFCYADCTLLKKVRNTNINNKDIEKTFNEEDYHYVSYNAYANNAWINQKNKIPSRSNSDGKYHPFMTDDSNPFNDSVVIIDEIHNILNTLHNERSKKKTDKNFTKHIYQQLMDATNVKIIALSGTPIVNHPVELCYLFNLLRGNKEYTFDTREEKFNEDFFKISPMGNIEIKNQEMFMRRINGLVSYFQGYTDNMFAKVVEDDVMVGFTQHQGSKYMESRNIEWINTQKSQRIENMNSFSSQPSLSIKSSNVVFPLYLWNKNELKSMGLKRNGKTINVDKTLQKYEYKNLKNEVVKINGLINTKQKLSEVTDIVVNILDNDKKPLHVDNDLSDISIKAYHIIKRIQKSNGPVIVYSQFESIYGISLLAEALRQNGFFNVNSYKSNKKIAKMSMSDLESGVKSNKNKPGFMIWSGNTNQTSHDIKDLFNDVKNKNGEMIKVFLMTTAGKEGISLRNIRQVHIMEPYWNNVLLKQVIGRGVRITSHKDLDETDFIDLRINVHERTNNVKMVNVFKYYAFEDNRDEVFNSKEYLNSTGYQKLKIEYDTQLKMKKNSIDYTIKKIADDKTLKSDLILELLKRNSIDCQLNLNSKDYDCFTQNKIIEYFSSWYLSDDKLLTMENNKKLKLINYFNKVYWVDDLNNVFERSDKLIKYANYIKFDDYYTKVGTYDNITGQILGDDGHDIYKYKNTVSMRNFLEIILQSSIENTNVISLTDESTLLYMMKLKPKKLLSTFPEYYLNDNDPKTKKILDLNTEFRYVKEGLYVRSGLDYNIIEKFQKDETDLIYIDLSFYTNISEINILLSFFLQQISYGKTTVILKNYLTVMNNDLLINSSFLNKFIFKVGLDDKYLIQDEDDHYVIFDGSNINIDENSLHDIFFFLYTSVWDSNIDASLIDLFNTIVSSGITTMQRFIEVCESKTLLNYVLYMDDDVYDKIMSYFTIEVLEVEDETILLEEVPEIFVFLQSISEKLQRDNYLQEYFQNFEDIGRVLVNNNISTLKEMERSYKSENNFRFKNMIFDKDSNINTDIINTIIIFYKPQLLRVVDIKANHIYLSLTEDFKKSYKNKDGLVKLINNIIGGL